MRAKDIHVGGEYWTKIGGQRVKVRVVMTRKGGVGIGRMGKFQVERVDNGQLLPKWRSAQALHPTGEGPWPGMMEKQEYSGFDGADDELPDGQIIRIVHRAIQKAEREGENWAEYVDEALLLAGVDIADEQPDGSDAWEIVRLADGRSVRMTRAQYDDERRYSIS